MKKNHFQALFVILPLLAGAPLVSAQPAAPTLGVAPAGSQVVLFYPTTATNYVLQSATNLSAPNWTTITNAVPVTAVLVTNATPVSFFRLALNAAANMVQVPAGSFTMGDSLDAEADAIPTVSVYVSAFYMDSNLVSYAQWQTIYNFATNAGYAFDNSGAGKASSHPVQTVNWYDAAKWCNARSQQAGLIPAYYTNSAMTALYTNGDVDALYVNWSATGFRLPTEAEWEKAARGGTNGLRFPFGNTISESQANYYGNTSAALYDLGPNGNNLQFLIGMNPYTSPVGFFAPNGYGLYDMAGNVSEWCWDWYGTPYAGGSNPQGPVSGTTRVYRGGNWNFNGTFARCASRFPIFGTPSTANNFIGFRCVIGQ